MTFDEPWTGHVLRCFQRIWDYGRAHNATTNVNSALIEEIAEPEILKV